MFRLKMNYSFELNGGKLEGPKPIFFYFKRDFVLTTDILENELNFSEIDQKLLSYIKEDLKIEGKVLKLKNLKPMGKVKFSFSFRNKIEAKNDFEFILSKDRIIDDECEIKFQQDKHFRFQNSDNCKFKFFLKRITVDEYNSWTNKVRSKNRPYETCVFLDSETEREMPELANAKYFNHNGILFSGNCWLKR